MKAILFRLCFAAAVLLLPAICAHAQGQLPPQLQTDRERNGGSSGASQLMTDSARMQAAQAAQATRAQAQMQAMGEDAGAQLGQGAQDGGNASVGRQLGAAAAADALNAASGYLYGKRIVYGRAGTPLEVGPDGIVRPKQPADRRPGQTDPDDASR